MPTTPRSQSALAADQNFQKRLSSLLLSEAIVVAGEDASTPSHQQRRQLAQQIITNPVAAETSYNFEAGAIETSATDAEIRSQISSIWNILAGV